jgi:hypothetical protein
MSTIIQDRYPSGEWNIYAAQASDGDNWHNDSAICTSLLNKNIMPFVQYYAYIEITEDSHQNLWEEYTQLNMNWSNFAMKRIEKIPDIYPVFRNLFEKRTT